MKAILITFEVTARVVVADDSGDSHIIAVGRKQALKQLEDSFYECVTRITDDIEMPYGSKEGEK